MPRDLPNSHDDPRFADKLRARKAELIETSAISQGARAAVTLDQQSVGRVSRIDAMQ
ncbi:MAG: hypothetical protein AAFQ45_04930 [Pseudomonadota bacterium]